MAVGAEMSGVPTKIHVIPYGITVKPGFVPNYTTSPQFETVPNYFQLKKSKLKKRKKKLKRSVALLTPRFSLSLYLYSPPRYRLRERKNKLHLH